MIPKTNEIRIETSTTCNASCKFCPLTTNFDRKREIMSLDKFKFYLDKSLQELDDQITQMTFSGMGEVFLDDGFLDKVRYSSSKGLEIHILTNGTLVTEKNIDDLYDIGIKDIRFSLHTMDRDNYTMIMGYRNNKYNFNNTMNIINYSIKNKPNNVEVIVTSVIDGNENDISDLINEFKNRCILEIWKPHNWVYSKVYRKGELIKDTCGRPFNGPIQIQVNGDIIPCCFDYNNKLVLGNLNDNTISEIFNDDKFIELYKCHKEGKCEESNLICKDCDQLMGKDDVLIYNNRMNSVDRIKYTSTGLKNIEKI